MYSFINYYMINILIFMFNIYEWSLRIKIPIIGAKCTVFQGWHNEELKMFKISRLTIGYVIFDNYFKGQWFIIFIGFYSYVLMKINAFNETKSEQEFQNERLISKKFMTDSEMEKWRKLPPVVYNIKNKERRYGYKF